MDGTIPRCRPAFAYSLFGLGDHAVDGGERRAGVLEIPLGALRVGLVEKLVDLLGIGVAQGIGVDLVLDGFVNGVSSPSHEARHGGANHDTSKHPRLSLSKFVVVSPKGRESVL